MFGTIGSNLKKEKEIDGIVVCTIYHICAGEKHRQETHVKDRKDRKLIENHKIDFKFSYM